MPQLTPYYFSNENNYIFFIMASLIYIFSKFVLPVSISLTSSRCGLFVV